MSAFQSEPSSVDAGTDAANEAKSAAQPPANSGKPAEPPLLTHQSTTDDQAERSDGKRSGTVTILSPREREWDGSLGSAPRDEDAQPSSAGGKRRIAAMAAVVAIAVIGGAAGGALATAGFNRSAADDSAAAAAKQMQALSQEIARIDADLNALKTSADQLTKQSSAQSSKSSDRFEKLEKAQADVAAKLSKLGETVDKLRPAPVAAAPAAAAPKETTGSIAATAPKPDVGRLPTVEGWVLREVADGGAVIEGRQGAFEVFAGDPVPGLGRVDAIRRQDGRWVVVTSRGLIVAR